MNDIKERELKGGNGWLMLAITVLGILAGIVLFAVSVTLIGGDDNTEHPAYFALTAAGIILFVVSLFCMAGLKVIAPNEAIVLTLFGKYHGTIKKDGFFFVNPFCSSVNPAAAFGGKGGRKLSLKAMTLNNEKQKVNDEEGNIVHKGNEVLTVDGVTDPVYGMLNRSGFIEQLKADVLSMGGLNADLSMVTEGLSASAVVAYQLSSNNNQSTLQKYQRWIAEMNDKRGANPS